MATFGEMLKAPLYKTIDHFFSSYYVQEKLWQVGQKMFLQPTQPVLERISLHPLPYQYGSQNMSTAIGGKGAPIFITARFRSGSTFLWQLFRHISGVTSYYEPLNESKWFLRGQSQPQVDQTHLGAKDYGAEYEGMEDLDRFFDPSWSTRCLYMDHTHYDQNLRRYIQELIRRAKGRAALQFNHADFRLPWLRANFPEAYIVHLYRHPREQWVSIVRKGASIPLDAKFELGAISNSDGFYTLDWARDMRHVFPFLEPAGRHPYELHYLLWRLSYSFGRTYGNISVSYEEFVSNFEEVADSLFQSVGIENADLVKLSKLNCGKTDSRWPSYAKNDWFSKLEAKCDRELETFFSQAGISAA